MEPPSLRSTSRGVMMCKHIRSAVIGLAHALCRDTWQARRCVVIVLVLRNSGCTTVYNKTPKARLVTLEIKQKSCRFLIPDGIQITDDGVASLCQALQTPTCKVTDLGLEDNQITDAGVASLCEALQTPTCKVTMLYLGRNQITDAGAASLCQALQTPTCKVTDLDLAGNQITDAGVASLCQALQTPTCKVTDLDLVGNQITDAGVASLRQASQPAACKVLS
ncbi:hypothetical protein pdam_00004199 [Pocillopora damicornis]|uniref:Uncharacterized protein n=1 Tax=Pocillopora damicornis TaxID=46731 RepID=A0A3M6UGS4_POCDA|nr:hypothetical protein pdam_00004199 [Pocillopora damicornis]